MQTASHRLSWMIASAPRLRKTSSTGSTRHRGQRGREDPLRDLGKGPLVVRVHGFPDSGTRGAIRWPRCRTRFRWWPSISAATT